MLIISRTSTLAVPESGKLQFECFAMFSDITTSHSSYYKYWNVVHKANFNSKTIHKYKNMTYHLVKLARIASHLDLCELLLLNIVVKVNLLLRDERLNSISFKLQRVEKILFYFHGQLRFLVFTHFKISSNILCNFYIEIGNFSILSNVLYLTPTQISES